MDISADRIEALKEVGNIGAGNAATSLSELMQIRIQMTVPKVWFVSLHELDKAIGDIEEPKAALYLKVKGDAPGKAMFVLSEHSAGLICKTLLGQSEIPNLFQDQMAQSVLKEVGNIMVSSFVTALASFSGTVLQISTPAFALDMIGALIDAVLLEGGVVGDKVLIIDTKFSGMGELEGKFLFIPDEGALDKLLGVFGV